MNNKNKELENQDPALDKINYPAKDDIYNKAQKIGEIDPDDLTKTKSPVRIEPVERPNEKGFEDDLTGGDLDIPGAELDDEAELTGAEDEENNYYSLGGDNHSDLDEEKE
jgi:hypothetical protein